MLRIAWRGKPSKANSFWPQNEKSNFGNGDFVRVAAIKSPGPNDPTDPDPLFLDRLFLLQNTNTDPMVSLSD